MSSLNIPAILPKKPFFFWAAWSEDPLGGGSGCGLPKPRIFDRIPWMPFLVAGAGGFRPYDKCGTVSLWTGRSCQQVGYSVQLDVNTPEGWVNGFMSE